MQLLNRPRTLVLLSLLYLVCALCVSGAYPETPYIFKNAFTLTSSQNSGVTTVASKVDNDGNIITVITFVDEVKIGDQSVKPYTKGSKNHALVKIAPNKKPIWIRGIESGTTLSTDCKIVRFGSDGSIYMVLTTTAPGVLKLGGQTVTSTKAYAANVVKYSSDGEIKWISTSEGSQYFAIREVYLLNDGSVLYFASVILKGDFYLGDTTYTGAYSNERYTLVKLKADGTKDWVKTMQTAGAFTSIGTWKNGAVTSDTFFFACDWQSSAANDKIEYDGSGIVTASAANNLDAYMLAIALSDGNFKYAKTVTGTSHEQLITLIVSSDGVYIVGKYASATATVTGSGTPLTNAKSGKTDVFVVRYQLNGVFSFAKSLGGSYDDFPDSTPSAASGDGGIFVSYFEDESSDNKIHILKFKPDGTTSGNITLSSTSSSSITIDQYTTDNGALVKWTAFEQGVIDGLINVPAGVNLIKLNSEGAISWKTLYSFSPSAYTKADVSIIDKENKFIYHALTYTSELTIGSVSVPVKGTIDMAVVKVSATNGTVMWVSPSIGYSGVSFLSNTVTPTSMELYNDTEVYLFGNVPSSSAEYISFDTVSRKADKFSFTVYFSVLSTETKICQDVVPRCNNCQSYSTCADTHTYCYGNYEDSVRVCSGQGSCIRSDVCGCNEGWAGFKCHKTKSL
jgi:hypothetical protein